MTTVKDEPVISVSRPGTVVALIVLLVFLGITALGGGIAMVFGVGGEIMLPDEWLDGIPLIDNWLLPGLVLGIGFGVGSLLVAYGVVRRPTWEWLGWIEGRTGHHWSWAAALAIGATHIVWILLELVFMPEATWLQAVYGAVGVSLILLPLLPSVRRYLALPMGLSTEPKGSAGPR